VIKSSTFGLAVNAAVSFSSSGKTLVPQTNTVLQELVRLSVPSSDYVPESQEHLLAYGDMLEATTQGSVDNPSEHDKYSDGLVHDLSKLVNSHISYARNVVKPVMLGFAEKLQCFTEQLELKSKEVGLGRYEIIEKYVPDLLRDESFLDTLKRFDNGRLLEPEANKQLLCASRTHDELLQLLSTGSNRFDEMIGKLVANLPSNMLESVWNSNFTKNNQGNYIPLTSINSKNIYERLEVALLVYLFANKIYDDVQEQEVSMALPVYRDAVNQIREYAGSVIVFSLKKAVLNSQGKVIIIESNERQIFVNGDLYRTWVQNGGKPEIILGSVISSSQYATPPAITEEALNEKADQFARNYESYRTYLTVSENSKKIDHLKNYIKIEVLQGLGELDELEKVYIQKNPGYYEIVKKELDQVVSGFTLKDLQDVHYISRIVIAKVRFYYTSAYEIFESMNEAALANSDIDPREAALLASINYLADYLADQISIA